MPLVQLSGPLDTRAIRRIPTLAKLPIVAMTANAMEQDRQLCIEAGMNDSLTKPIDPRVLWATLLRWISPPSPGNWLPTFRLISRCSKSRTFASSPIGTGIVAASAPGYAACAAHEVRSFLPRGSLTPA